jgi:hypothetical protein
LNISAFSAASIALVPDPFLAFSHYYYSLFYFDSALLSFSLSISYAPCISPPRYSAGDLAYGDGSLPETDFAKRWAKSFLPIPGQSVVLSKQFAGKKLIPSLLPTRRVDVSHLIVVLQFNCFFFS